jgi:hypothetical protein
MNVMTEPMHTTRTDNTDTGSGPRRILSAGWSRNPILLSIATFQLALPIAFLAGMAVDPRTVGGEPVWLKPAKFAASLALFAATLGWLGIHLPVDGRALRRVSIGIAAVSLLEIGLIAIQAARGVESHFNDATALNEAIYLTMGAGVLTMTVLVAWLLVRSWRIEFPVAPAFAWGIRFGLLLFVLGSLEGGVMVAIESNGFESGLAVPLVGGEIGSDLRVAHFVGIHGLQVLPLAGYLAAVAGDRGRLGRPIYLVAVVALVHFALFVAAATLAVAPAIR